LSLLIASSNLSTCSLSQSLFVVFVLTNNKITTNN
jgi:hypothetical protein